MTKNFSCPKKPIKRNSYRKVKISTAPLVFSQDSDSHNKSWADIFNHQPDNRIKNDQTSFKLPNQQSSHQIENTKEIEKRESATANFSLCFSNTLSSTNKGSVEFQNASLMTSLCRKNSNGFSKRFIENTHEQTNSNKESNSEKATSRDSQRNLRYKRSRSLDNCEISCLSREILYKSWDLNGFILSKHLRHFGVMSTRNSLNSVKEESINKKNPIYMSFDDFYSYLDFCNFAYLKNISLFDFGTVERLSMMKNNEDLNKHTENMLRSKNNAHLISITNNSSRNYLNTLRRSPFGLPEKQKLLYMKKQEFYDNIFQDNTSIHNSFYFPFKSIFMFNKNIFLKGLKNNHQNYRKNAFFYPFNVHQKLTYDFTKLSLSKVHSKIFQSFLCMSKKHSLVKITTSQDLKGSFTQSKTKITNIRKNRIYSGIVNANITFSFSYLIRKIFIFLETLSFEHETHLKCPFYTQNDKIHVLQRNVLFRYPILRLNRLILQIFKDKTVFFNSSDETKFKLNDTKINFKEFHENKGIFGMLIRLLNLTKRLFTFINHDKKKNTSNGTKYTYKFYYFIKMIKRDYFRNETDISSLKFVHEIEDISPQINFEDLEIHRYKIHKITEKNYFSLKGIEKINKPPFQGKLTPKNSKNCSFTKSIQTSKQVLSVKNCESFSKYAHPELNPQINFKSQINEANYSLTCNKITNRTPDSKNNTKNTEINSININQNSETSITTKEEIFSDSISEIETKYDLDPLLLLRNKISYNNTFIFTKINPEYFKNNYLFIEKIDEGDFYVVMLTIQKNKIFSISSSQDEFCKNKHEKSEIFSKLNRSNHFFDGFGVFNFNFWPKTGLGPRFKSGKDHFCSNKIQEDEIYSENREYHQNKCTNILNKENINITYFCDEKIGDNKLLDSKNVQNSKITNRSLKLITDSTINKRFKTSEMIENCLTKNEKKNKHFEEDILKNNLLKGKHFEEDIFKNNLFKGKHFEEDIFKNNLFKGKHFEEEIFENYLIKNENKFCINKCKIFRNKSLKKNKYFRENLTCIKKSLREYSSYRDRSLKLKEIQILSLLKNQENILKIISAWEENGFLYIETEFCDLGNLTVFINKKSNIELPVLKKLFYELVCALNHCHINNIIHGDVKPRNIFIKSTNQKIMHNHINKNNHFEPESKIIKKCNINNQKEIKSLKGNELNKIICKNTSIQSHDIFNNLNEYKFVLGDFNISRFSFEIFENDCDGSYMAPENLKNIGDHKSDIFSLGIVLMEIITKKPSNYIRKNLANTLTSIENCELHFLISQMVHICPEDRWSTSFILDYFINKGK